MQNFDQMTIDKTHPTLGFAIAMIHSISAVISRSSSIGQGVFKDEQGKSEIKAFAYSSRSILTDGSIDDQCLTQQRFP